MSDDTPSQKTNGEPTLEKSALGMALNLYAPGLMDQLTDAWTNLKDEVELLTEAVRSTSLSARSTSPRRNVSGRRTLKNKQLKNVSDLHISPQVFAKPRLNPVSL